MANPTELLLNVLAGLGLFFVGIKTVGRNLNALVSEQFRGRIKRASKNLLVSSLFGALIGFVTQSGRTTAFIIAGFVQGGLIDVRHALLIVLWSNLGCTLIVTAAVVPIHLFALFLLGAAGACIAFERPRPLLNAANAVFGLALMLFGLKMMSASASVLTEVHWFSRAMELAGTSFGYPLAGLLLTFVAQSHMSIVLIAVTFAGHGILDFNQTIMLIYGTHAGSSLITYLTGTHFRGRPGQIVIGQIAYNLVGIALFTVIFLGDYLITDGDLMLHRIANAFSSSPGSQAAIVVIIFNAVTPLLLTVFHEPFQRLCARLSPPLQHEELAELKYLHEGLAGAPVATLMLAEKEQLRLLRRMPDYLALTRGEPAKDAARTLASYHVAFTAVSARMQRFQRSLMSQTLVAGDTEWLLNQQRRQELLNAIEDVCHDLCATMSSGIDPQVKQLAAGVVEALDTMLLTVIGGMENNDPAELETLDAMTRDRGTAMDSVRKRYLTAAEHLSLNARSQILLITSMFERAAWAVRRFGDLLKTSGAIEGWSPAEP